ncbi:MAG: TonB-like protein [Proteobacteria bacterium]|nr:TonB-like protein [Pseudomonadota bacterium]
MYTAHGEWNSADRLLITLVLASIVHAVLILGVSFELPKPAKIQKSLEIALVRTPSRQAPEQADFLAQENQFGSGEAVKKAIPKAVPVPQQGKGQQLTPAPNLTRAPEVRPRQVIKQASAEKKAVEDSGVDIRVEEERPHISADALRQQITEFSAEFAKSQENQAKRPRMVYINSVNAHKYKAAAYERAWQDKVERIGNLNYPDEARRRNLSGGLLLSVGIKPDGSIHSIQVRRSSGEAVLDDAAMRIVRLSAPFSPFPEELKQEVDVLVITRTWKFSSDNRVETIP